MEYVHTLCRFGVQGRYGEFAVPEAIPAGGKRHLYLARIIAVLPRHTRKSIRTKRAETAPDIAPLEAEQAGCPEIDRTIAEVADNRHPIAAIAKSENGIEVMVRHMGKYGGNMIWRMLAVAVDRDDSISTKPESGIATGLKRRPLSHIDRVADQGDGWRQGPGKKGDTVIRTVIDHDDMVGMSRGKGGNRRNARAFVISGNDNDDAIHYD